MILDTPVEEIGSRYVQLIAKPEQAAAARAFKPFHERSLLGRAVLLFENPPREQLQALGELGTPTVADLFVAMIEGGAT
jgi:ABC-2 type transport system ATP-binding protein